MKKKLLSFAAVAAMLFVPQLASAQAAEFPEEEYLILNYASDKFWGAGNSWGTQASLVEHPEYLKLLPQDDGTYWLETQVSNGGTAYYFNGDFMDNDKPISLTITKIDEPVGYLDDEETMPYYGYTIAGNTNDGQVYYGWDEKTTVLGKNLDISTEDGLYDATWVIIPLKEAKEKMVQATVKEPIDVTYLILDANFGRNNRWGQGLSTNNEQVKNADLGAAWTFEAKNKNVAGDNTNYCVESFHQTFTMSQKVKDAPAGVYALTAQGFYRQDGSNDTDLPVFYANDETATFPLKTGTENSMNDASQSFSKGLYTIDPIFFELEEGQELTIGAKLENNTNLWCIWDNFVLTYYGPSCSVDDAKNAAIFGKVDDLMSELLDVIEDVEVEALKSDLESVYESFVGEEITTVEDATSAVEVLTEAIDKGKASVIAKDILPKMKQIVDGTNVYTDEALNAYYTQWKEKYDAGELTFAEASALEDPLITRGWHAQNSVDDFLLSAWPEANKTYADPWAQTLYINTWSTEGQSDGSNFKVPFFEFWTDDTKSLMEKTWTATMNVAPGTYDVSAWVRVRIKNGAEAPAYGITMQTNEGEAVNVCDGEKVGEGPFFLKQATATGEVGEDGVLNIKFITAADNNISWLSFQNVNYTKSIVDGISTVSTTAHEGKVYNLNGQQMKGQMKSGLYIVDGKKVVIK